MAGLSMNEQRRVLQVVEAQKLRMATPRVAKIPGGWRTNAKFMAQVARWDAQRAKAKASRACA